MSAAPAPSQCSLESERGPSPHSARPARAPAQAAPQPGPRTPEVGGWPRGTGPGTLPCPGSASGAPHTSAALVCAPSGPRGAYLSRQVSRLRLSPSPAPSPLTWGAGECLAGALHGPPLGTHFLPPRSAAAHLDRGPAPRLCGAARPRSGARPFGLVRAGEVWRRGVERRWGSVSYSIRLVVLSVSEHLWSSCPAIKLQLKGKLSSGKLSLTLSLSVFLLHRTVPVLSTLSFSCLLSLPLASYLTGFGLVPLYSWCSAQVLAHTRCSTNIFH